MSLQQEITKFFLPRRKMSRSDGNGENLKRISVWHMKELCKTPEKIHRGKGTTFNPHNEDIICLVSSDEENCFSSPTHCDVPPSRPSPIKKETPKKDSPGSHSSKACKGTPTKFFSPIKKRSIKKSSPIKSGIVNAASIVPKKLFPGGEELLEEACEGQDDKTKFLLRAVHNTVQREAVSRLVSDSGRVLLRQLLRLRGAAPRLVCRLYWRKARWYRRTELISIVKELKNEDDLFQRLLDNGFLEEGKQHNMEFDHYIDDVLRQDELKNICKNLLKHRSQSKKDAAEMLRAYCRSSHNITNYLKHQTNNTMISNEERVLKLLCEAAGECYKLTDSARDVLDRVYVLSYLGLDPDVLRGHKLELLLLNVKIGRDAFPAPSDIDIDTPDVVFQTRQEFDNYMMAHLIYENFLQCTDSAMRLSIIQHAFNMFRELNVDVFASIPPWLRQFTPAYLYMKIMEAGLPELKQRRDASLYRLAVDMLSALLAQSLFRTHKRAAWYDEKVLILHNYLREHQQAADVLLSAFDSPLSAEVKDALRPRAHTLANQRHSDLTETKRDLLKAHATKQQLLESVLPHTHFYKQAMENTSKGKIVFEVRNEDGTRTMSSVENYAIACYTASGEYTVGRHWEGKLVNTIFFLLFWDIIYSKPQGARGIFLCRYQKYPLDMFTESFYETRKTAIHQLLEYIEEADIEDVLKKMFVVWQARPEGEHSGVCTQLGWREVEETTRCLGARRVAAVCRRLAADYRYTHSGFPDLTMWTPGSRKIKFAEVKSDTDKPSMKQIQWMQYLLANNISAELCYVGTRGTHS